ncbi:hypothetical protein FHY03_003270 [Sphingomonas sp. BK345]|nr:hypothetical protein [Sphingomonas sp. BK345]
MTARDLRWGAAGLLATSLLILASAAPPLLATLASPLARL